MAFCFRSDDLSLTAALHRIAGSELSRALAAIPDQRATPPAGIHDVRKRIKKVRGLLRLLRPGLRDYQVENAALREAAQSISGLRDSAVRLATLDMLFPDLPDALAPLRPALEGEMPSDTSMPDAVPQTRVRLLEIQQRVQHWHVRGKDRHVLAEGLARTRKRAQLALDHAARDTSIEAMHEWRKRAKDHWYQSRLFTPVWPDVIAPQAEAASVLTEALGVHHDLGVLLEHVETAHQTRVSGDAMDLLRRRVAEALTDIESRVFRDGRRLIAGPPRGMAEMWVECWLLWRD
jgi:CHAD domain-containing protein